MASSQVEIASSSPFGCVLKDNNNRRERYRDANCNSSSNSKPNFQRNLKDLVRDHLHSCISISPRVPNSDSDENFGCWGGHSSKNNNNNNNNHNSRRSNRRIGANNNANNQNSPARSDSSGDVSVSSLVEKWRGFEAETKQNINNGGNQNPGTASASSSSNIPSRVNSECSIEVSETANCAFGDWESDKTETSEQERMRVADIIRKWPSFNDNSCEPHQQKEKEGQAVPLVVNPMARLRIGSEQGGETRAVCSPRIRGRQAIADLHMIMERERYKEVQVLAGFHAVSKFPKRGRIQSLLRLRLLRHEVSVQHERSPDPRARELNHAPNASNITSLRERFGTAAEQDSTSERSTAAEHARDAVTEREFASTRTREPEHKLSDTRITASECDSISLRSTVVELDLSSTRNPVAESSDTSSSTAETSFVSLRSTETNHDISSAKSTATGSGSSNTKTTSGDRNFAGFKSTEAQDKFSDKRSIADERDCEFASTSTAMENGTSRAKSTLIEQHDSSKKSSCADAISSKLDFEKASTHCPSEQITKHLDENNAQETRSTPLQSSVSQTMEEVQEEIPSLEIIWQATTTSYHDWEEEMIAMEQEAANEHHFFETSLDWISDIARPRSYWEDRRQARYQEIFTTRSQDEEIRQLLERGSVAAVLASDFPDRMDRLIMSSVQRQIDGLESKDKREDPSIRAFFQRQRQPFYTQEEQQAQEQREQHEGCEQQGHEDEEEDMEVMEIPSVHHQYHDVSDYYDETPSPSQLPWSYQDREASDDSDHAASTSLQQPSLVHSYDHDTHEGSFFKNSPSMEMELIYDLRTHMQQLYREMAELRKSINSCMDMQVKLQTSVRDGTSVAINCSERENGRQLNKKDRKKGSCYICYEKRVDSLLYRCGHMCTCFECANELQSSSRRCPICRAQIIDVVRAYPDAQLE